MESLQLNIIRDLESQAPCLEIEKALVSPLADRGGAADGKILP